ncbi:MAG TPA: hypothetical protein VFB96_06160 [Pirellulaceae bacterium]|nr:hypothetical protein [Pirellulaceae bacterium]
MVRHVTFALCLCVAVVACGQEAPAKSAKDEAARRRLELMLSALADCQISSPEIAIESALKTGKTPLLRYDDPTRGLGEKSDGLQDASVWRLGETGRPTALITLEIYRNGPKKAILSYEFLSLTPSPLELKSPRGPLWTPTSTDLRMAPLDKAPSPADTPRGRLVQMRQLARRFTVQETLPPGDNKIECRLLAQPIDRYDGGQEKVLDGAIFAFANGTNPEVALLLECTEREWFFGLARLSSAALQANLDGQSCFEAARVTLSGAKDSYAGMGYSIDWQD